MYAYEDIFNPARLPSPAPTERPAPTAPSGAQPSVARQPHSLRSWPTVVFASLLIVLLLAFATVACAVGQLTGYGLASAAGALGLAVLLFARKSTVPQGFLAPFLLVFVLVFGAAVSITSLLPESYLSIVRLNITPNMAEAPLTPRSRSPVGSYDPYLVQTEFEVMQSEEILGPVIEKLDLDREWGKRYGNGKPLKPSETMALLRSRIDLRPIRNTSIIAIRVFGERPDEAALIANTIAEVYRDHSNPNRLQVEIIDRAVPGIRPVRPNKPLNLAIGILLGLVLGTMAGVAGVAFRARKVRG